MLLSLLNQSFSKEDMSKLNEALAKKGGFKTIHSMGHDLLLSGDLSFAEYERILSRG